MNTQICEEAAEWLVEFRTDVPSVEARRQFAAWLRQSPDHIRAYLDALALWEDARCYDRQHELDIDGLVSVARADTTVADLWADHRRDGVAERATPDQRDARTTRRAPLRGLVRPRTAMAALLSLVLNGGIAWFVVNAQHTYSTNVAEQRSVRLSDGSRVDLDAVSHVRVDFGRHERTVELLSGQALFHVSKDTTRPFVVRIGDARVAAVGTEFDVNRTTLTTEVTVLEGRVVVLRSAAPTSRLAKPSVPPDETRSVDAGQQTTITHDAISKPQAADTAVATAWTRRLLVFVSTPLPEAAEEFNRFSARRLVIDGGELADFHVTGKFLAFDPESLADFVAFLRTQPQLDVADQGDQINVRTRSRHSP